jgi:hypothetical protein
MKARTAGGILVLGLGLTLTPAVEEEGRTGVAVRVLPSASQSGIRILDLRGRISVRGGDSLELSYTSTALRNRGRSVPLSVTERDGWWVVEAVPRRHARKHRVQIVVPRTLRVEIRAVRSTVQVSGFESDVTLQGAGANATFRSIDGSVDVDVDGGKVRAVGIAGDLVLRSRAATVAARKVEGGLFGYLREGVADLGELGGLVELDLDETELMARDIPGNLRIRAHGGRVEIQRARRGAALELDGTELEATGCGGELTISTNAAVTLRDNRAAVRVDGYGAPVSAERNHGLVEVKTDGAPVRAASIAGPVRVAGDDLDIDLDGIEGELMVFASASRIDIRDLAAAVTVENDRGDVSIANARDEVTVFNRDGGVELKGVSGPVWVEAESDEVAVEWVSLEHDADSFIGNDSGDVSIVFPASGGCNFDGTARFGRIQGDLPGIELSGNGRRGQGRVNGKDGPGVRVESDGDIVLARARSARGARREGLPPGIRARRDAADQ